MDLYHTTDMNGISEVNPDTARMQALIEQLDSPDIEDADHPDLSLVDDTSGWSITLYPSGIATFEQLGDDDAPPRFITDISRDKALQLWGLLSRGKIDELQQQAWQHE